MEILISATLSVVLTFASLFGAYNYLPLKALEGNNGVKNPLGSTITTINGSDTISSSRSVINANFTALNNTKMENSTTSVQSITTLNNLTTAGSLATVGTITSGTWNGSTISVAKGGTASTTPTGLLWGNGSGTLTSVAAGTSGQLLTSNGSGVAPSYSSASFDQTQNYTNTGIWTFASSTIQSTSTIGTLNVGKITATSTLAIGGQTYTFPSSQSASSSLYTNGSGTLSWIANNSYNTGTTTVKGATFTWTFNHNLGRIPRKVKVTTYGIIENGAASAPMYAESVGVATSTVSAEQTVTSFSRIVGSGTSKAYTTSGEVIGLVNDTTTAKFTGYISAWDSNTLTMIIDTNANGTNDGVKSLFIEVE